MYLKILFGGAEGGVAPIIQYDHMGDTWSRDTWTAPYNVNNILKYIKFRSQWIALGWSS